MRVALVLVTALLATLALVGQARSAEPAPTYTECGFIQAKWLGEGKTSNASKEWVGSTTLHAGWTPISGTMGATPAVLVCR